MERVYLGLGANVGDRLQYLQNALEAIGTRSRIMSISSVYETEPVEMESEHWFYNMAVGIETGLRPPELLRHLKEIEALLGREPSTHLKDREIDIDILLYDGIRYKDATLEIPHPHMHQRRFALEPLREIAPDVVDPVTGKTIDELWRDCRTPQHVERLERHVSLTHLL